MNPRSKSVCILPAACGAFIQSIDDDELAKRFDYLMYTIEYADMKGLAASKPKLRVVETASKLATKGSIAMIKRQEELIIKVQTDEFWQEADIFNYEIVRKAFRELIKFLESDKRKTYYTNFTDEVIEVKENVGDFTVND